MDDREFGVEVNESQIRADFDGDGKCLPEEKLVGSLGRVLGLAARSQDESDIIVRFDRADAMWLRGYTHFLAGVLE